MTDTPKVLMGQKDRMDELQMKKWAFLCMTVSVMDD